MEKKITEITFNEAFEVAKKQHTLGLIPQAVYVYKQIIATDINHAEAWHYLGVAEHQQGNHQQGIECIQKSLEIAPENLEAQYNLATIFQLIHKEDEAEKLFHSVLAVNPVYPEVYFNLGIIAQEKGAIEAAEKHYLQAIEQNNQMAAAWYRLGSLYQENDTEKARKYFKKSAVLDVRYLNYFKEKGIDLRDKKEE